MPRPVYFYLAASFFMGLANTIFDVVFNFYLAERGIEEGDAGVIYAIATGAMAVAVVPLLFLRRYMSQRALLIGASVLYTVPFAGLPFVASVASASVVLSLILAGMLGLLSVGNAIAGGQVPQAARTRLFSAFFISYLGAGAIGSALVSLVSGWLHTSDLEKYRFFLLLSFLAACVMLVLRIPSGTTAPQTASALPQEDLQVPGEKRNFVTLFVAAGFLGASIALFFRFANVLFAQVYDISVSDISLILGSDKIVSIFGAIFAPLLVRRFSLRPSAAVFGVLAVVGLLLQSLTVPLIVFAVLYLLRLLFNYCLMPLLDTVAMSGFAPARQMVSIGLRQSSFYLGGAVAAAVYGELLDGGHWQAALWVSAGCALIGSLAMTLVRSGEPSPRPAREEKVLENA
ncbi:MFS transporter [Streptomyces sp. CB00455]|uniref:MFS transporter n=1 Tax=Streptomyces sp. CB00455 TaxID=1703927 RepID=UPI0018FE53A1|nr:MFS transporter [Streptomyces sp. CB00455]